MSATAPRIGLVLGGGGIAGYAFHAAALGALQHVTGWDPRTAEVIVGTSAGSGVGSILRGGVSVKGLLTRLLTVPTDPESMATLRRVSGRGASLLQWGVGPAAPGLVARELLRGRSIRPSRLLAGALPKGPIDHSVVGDPAWELHGELWPEQATWVTAVDLRSGRREVFGQSTTAANASGAAGARRAQVDMATAVRASCAIPGFFSPQTINGRRYVDGGVHSMTNADLLAEFGLDLVVIVSPMSSGRLVATSPVSSAIRFLPTMQVRNERRLIEQGGSSVLLIEADESVVRTIGPNPMDPTRALPILLEANSSIYAEIAADPAADARALLSAAAKSIPSPPDVPYPEVAV